MAEYHRHAARVAILGQGNCAIGRNRNNHCAANHVVIKIIAEECRSLRCNGPICSPNYNADNQPQQIVLLSMDEYSQPAAGKITVHGNGLGIPSTEEVDKRAREIALIDERDPNEYTDADWDQARREILGEVLPSPPEETKENVNLQDEWEVTPKDSGHRVPRPGIDENEESLGEHLVADGVEEATHDQMLEARREELEQEGGIT
jgi:hypothetical protein